MEHSKAGYWHVSIHATDASAWGIVIREDVTGHGSIEVRGMTRAQAVQTLAHAALTLKEDGGEG